MLNAALKNLSVIVSFHLGDYGFFISIQNVIRDLIQLIRRIPIVSVYWRR